MPNLDNMLAPRALTAREVAEVACPHLIAYGVAHRAFIHTSIICDGESRDSATVYAAEAALARIVSDATGSVEQWLGDCIADRAPRFYQKAALKPAVEALCRATGDAFVRAPDAVAVTTLIDGLEERDGGMLDTLVAQAVA